MGKQAPLQGKRSPAFPLVYAPQWRPDSPADVPGELSQFGCLVGVARKP